MMGHFQLVCVVVPSFLYQYCALQIKNSELCAKKSLKIVYIKKVVNISNALNKVSPCHTSHSILLYLKDSFGICTVAPEYNSIFHY